MSDSSRPSDLLDLERGLHTTPDDVAALQRLRRERRLSTQEYLRALVRVPPTLRDRRRKRVYVGEPFRLP